MSSLRPVFLVKSAKVKCNSDSSLGGVCMCFLSKLSPVQWLCLFPKVRVNIVALI